MPGIARSYPDEWRPLEDPRVLVVDLVASKTLFRYEHPSTGLEVIPDGACGSAVR
jgi:hypothetical protein